MTYPVKYMPIYIYAEECWDILDTSFDGPRKAICTVYTEELAYRLTKYLNESEGFVYEP